MPRALDLLVVVRGGQRREQGERAVGEFLGLEDALRSGQFDPRALVRESTLQLGVRHGLAPARRWVAAVTDRGISDREIVVHAG